MNEFEQQLVAKISEGIHSLELKVTHELSELRGLIASMAKENEGQHKELRRIVEDNIETNTRRLNKHSEEIDDLRERLAKQEEWKDQFQKSVANKIAISQSITTVLDVVLSFALFKVFGG